MGLTLERLSDLSTEQAQIEIVAEYEKCQEDIGYCMRTYFTVMDPILTERVQFDMYPYQNKAVKDFEKYRYNMTMKTRQTGFTTVAAVYAAAYMCVRKNQVIYALANKMKNSRKFLRMVRAALDDARKRAPWLVPDYDKKNNGKDSFTVSTGCIITAEPNTEEAGRAETINLLFIDEVAAIDEQNPGRMEEIWAAAGPTLNRSRGTCIAISTPRGQTGWYFDQYTHAQEIGWNVIEAHWSKHPIYNKGLYMFAKSQTDKRVRAEMQTHGLTISHTKDVPGGKLIFFNDEWPDVSHPDDLARYKTPDTYQYILDGKLRSPWYDAESKRLGPRKTTCELDCSFAGSGGEVLGAQVLRALDLTVKNNPPINKPGKGLWKSYKEYGEFNPNKKYIVSVDTATGDGTDYSAFTVIECESKTVIATYKEQLHPDHFAEIIALVGQRFGDAMVIVENAGGGLTTLLRLKELKYPSIYYHKLKKKDPTKTEKKKKLGFWQGQDERALGGDKVEQWINSDKLKIYSEDLVAELHTWIWDKDGKRRHAPGKNDDCIMALQIGVYYIAYVLEKETKNRNIMNTAFSIEKTDWEKKRSNNDRGFNIRYL